MLKVKEMAEDLGTAEEGSVVLYELSPAFIGAWTILCVFDFMNDPAVRPREAHPAECFPEDKSRTFAGRSEITILEEGINLRPYQAFRLV